MSLSPRTDIDRSYRFDLSRIYETPEDWERAYEDLLERLSDLQSQSEPAHPTNAELEDLLDAIAECFLQRQRLELYATLTKNIATNDNDAADRMHRYRELTAEFEPAITAALRQLENISATITDLSDEYQWYALNLEEQARYICSAEVEEVIAVYEEPKTTTTRLFRAVWNEDFEPPTIERPDGADVEIRYGNLRTELSNEDRAYRKQVYEAFYEEADRYEHILTRSFAEKLKASHADVSVRGYDSLRDRAFRHRCYPESGLRAELPDSVHHVMFETIRNNLNPYHDALELRRARLEVNPLRPWDLHVSIADSEPHIEYEEAKRHILDALTPLGAEYVDHVRKFFAERRIDVFPTQDKRTDIPAYCPSSATDGPYILANFQEDVRTMFYLCHELGHAMHVEHHREGAARYATTPRPVEEIPSILHELFLVDYLVDQGGAIAEAARNRLLECVAGNFFEATRSSVFTHELAKRVENGQEVTVDRTRELVQSLQKEFLAPVEFGGNPGRRIPASGTRELYSNYQYVLGVTGALSVHSQLRNDGLSVETYRDFLRSTGQERSVELFERIGADIRTPAPFETAADSFAKYVEEVK